MNPKVSIILPTYNRAHFLQETIPTVLAQTFSDFEFIILDDASMDETETLIQSYHDDRIVYEKTASNHGEYWATNYAINKARGAYLTWVHSDDLLPKHSLETRIHVLEQNSLYDFVHADIEKIDEYGSVIQKLEAVNWPKEQIISEYLLPEQTRKKKYMIHHLSIMMKWNFFYKAGPFDCSLPFGGDIDWLIRALKTGNFTCVNETVYKYRSHPGTRRVVDIQQGIDKEKVMAMITRRYA